MGALRKAGSSWQQDVLERSLREALRWRVLEVLDVARPHWLAEVVLLAGFAVGWPGVTKEVLRRELDYLELRQLLSLNRSEPDWQAKLTREGVDIVEYTVDCEPGIARPQP